MTVNSKIKRFMKSFHISFVKKQLNKVFIFYILIRFGGEYQKGVIKK